MRPRGSSLSPAVPGIGQVEVTVVERGRLS